ncbi:MAG: carboxypeptidase regulatory-like domain-containing protein [Treponema sp.]|jgi:tetratricopeptide (TPR) repeat protein|nr:carboxypeptidase regulatory-like domain-containing protein [Treponema sp.]
MKAFNFIILIMGVLVSCASGPVPKERTHTLYGMIYDGDNRPVNDVKIHVDGDYKAASDVHGRFVIPNMKPNREYHISAEKEQHEKTSMDIFHADPSSVLYIHLFSADQLMAGAEEAIKKKDWLRAETFLERAGQAGGAYAPISYLRGVLEFYKDRYAEALSVLLDLAEKEKNAPHVYLFIADLYEYYINDREEAQRFLAKFLELRYDPEAESRLKKLEGI